MAHQELFDIEKESTNKSAQPVECLGMTFPNDEERRKYFTEKLREHLKDPEFRKIEGFPIGEDEDILALSDPPYYTACPNPWLKDFINQWEQEKKAQQPADNPAPYHREPFAADVSEGRSGLFYDAHSYHTKVPHKAVMHYILHYTEPGDIVFDGFCGTGMTGVAAQMCGDREQVEALGYQVSKDGTISQLEKDEQGKSVLKPFSKLGARHVILNDLSPIATFIAANYNTPIDINIFEKEASRVLKEVEDEYGWMYETLHTDGKTKGTINYTVWSDVFVCPECTKEVVFWEAAYNPDTNSIQNEFPCKNCNALLTKTNLDRAWKNHFDRAISQQIRQVKQIPVFINYTVNKTRAEKKPDSNDLDLVSKIESMTLPYWFPLSNLPNGFNTTQPKNSHGVTHVHHFYTKRNLWMLSAVREKLKTSLAHSSLDFLINSYDLTHSTFLSRIIFKKTAKKPVLTGYQSGTLYISSLPVEKNIINGIENQKLPIIKNSLALVKKRNIITTASAAYSALHNNSADYLFIDPPFGANLNYSELNFLWESWLKVWTNNKPEAIENKVQKKGPLEYRQLMTECFKEAYRILKPGHWMTVEFSNTRASVWNSIQTALSDAGFIVANVSALDKQQGSFKAVTTPTAVKQDLVISAYKPSSDFEKQFEEQGPTEEGVWTFIHNHLDKLVVVKMEGGEIQPVPERDPRILYDQLLAYYVRKGFPIPLSSPEFQAGLATRFLERDGMYFLPEQAVTYDRKKLTAAGMGQMSLFVHDEATAIDWLRQQLKNKPQSTQDIQPHFMKELGGWKKHEKSMELKELLEQNFLCYGGEEEVPGQIHSYLSSNFKDLRNLDKNDPTLRSKAADRWYVPDPNKAGDLEKLRERTLLREFDEYLPEGHERRKKEDVVQTLFPGMEKRPARGGARPLREFRLEAVRAGFKRAWQDQDYGTIVAVAERIPDSVLQNDEKLLMWYDQALTRMDR